MVWADPTNNALIITAPAKLMRAIMAIIDKLDIRRPQVLVEAIIAEVDVDKSAELGVNWAAFSNGQNIPAGAFVSPGTAAPIWLRTAPEIPSVSISSPILAIRVRLVITFGWRLEKVAGIPAWKIPLTGTARR